MDVERALRIRELMLREGLTLAGVRRRLEQEAVTRSAEDELLAEVTAAAAPAPPVDDVSPSVPDDVREGVAQVREALRELHLVLSRPLAPAVQRPPTPSAQAVQPDAENAVAAPTPRRASRPRQRVVDQPPPAPPRELTIEPEPAEPSLFTDADGQIQAAPQGSAARSGGRKRGAGGD